ncbi:hypothetical protein PUN28_014470 [Cardiocondyla obscurior]|uniref:Secreted protein n=1 Tax=Cardiocondyla obscurior TaxID=286306 RepID=A0AAW2F2R5_9HYME
MVSPWSRKSWRLFNVRLRMASRGGAGTTWFAGALYRTCTSSSSSLFVALAAASASSLTFFSSSSRAAIRCRNRSRVCCNPRTSSRNISCSLEY